MPQVRAPHHHMLGACLTCVCVWLPGVDPAATNLCMAQSGGLGDDGDNTILKHGLQERQNLAIMLLPTIIVNGVIERGTG